MNVKIPYKEDAVIRGHDFSQEIGEIIKEVFVVFGEYR